MAWVYTYSGETDYTDGYSTSSWQPESFAYGGRITFSEAGDIDQLGHWVRTEGDSITMKCALYDTSGNLVVDGGSIGVTSTSGSWRDVAAFTSTGVSATDYICLASGSTNHLQHGYDTANDGSFATEAYATFPADPETITAEGDSGQGYGARANFTASASDVTALPGAGTLTITGAIPTMNVSAPVGDNTIIIVPTGPPLS